MQELGLRSCVSRKFKVVTTDSNHELPIAPNITYIPCQERQLFLASILDLCTKEIVGWRLGSRMTTKLVLGALEDAYKAKKPKKGLIHHSDRGSQYASIEYRNKLVDYKMKASIELKRKLL